MHYYLYDCSQVSGSSTTHHGEGCPALLLSVPAGNFQIPSADPRLLRQSRQEDQQVEHKM